MDQYNEAKRCRLIAAPPNTATALMIREPSSNDFSYSSDEDISNPLDRTSTTRTILKPGMFGQGECSKGTIDVHVSPHKIILLSCNTTFFFLASERKRPRESPCYAGTAQSQIEASNTELITTPSCNQKNIQTKDAFGSAWAETTRYRSVGGNKLIFAALG